MQLQGMVSQEQAPVTMTEPSVVDLYINDEPEFWRQYNAYIMEGFNDNGETEPIHMESVQETVGC